MSAISWFEIPSTDIERGQKFYELILGVTLMNMDNPALKMRAFPVEDMSKDISGAVVSHEQFYRPSSDQGVLVYLNANPDVQLVLDRVVDAGGSILVPKTQISPEHGHMAVILDTEGNRIGLHSV